MGMEEKVLVPGVEYRGEADVGSEPWPGKGVVEKGAGCGLKEHSKQEVLVVEDKRVHLMGKGYDKVEIVCGQESLKPLLNPFESLQTLAFGAVAIAA